MYEYIYNEGKAGEPVLILLHGTGADETNLVPVAEVIAPDATVFSIRGNVSENGMNRYFKRHGEGNYDVEDLMQRGQELYQFIEEKSKELDFSLEDVVLFGFSNGSNIGINMLLLEEAKFNKAMLYAPMYPVDIEDGPDLSDAKIFLSMGENDPIVPQAESKNVIDIFEARGADVEKVWVNSHEINGDNLAAGKQWFENNK
jgi:phospholipase/carboxylesterase